VVCDQLELDSEFAPSTTPSTSYAQYDGLRPFWLSSVVCVAGTHQALQDCDHSRLIGYSADCSLASANSLFDNAEVNCGAPVPFRLSGGAIAGIVLGVLAVVTMLVLGIIYGPEKWKRRHK
jgi:hypothetical protein